ncbi:MAG: hypothetical protein AAF226_18595, partial [Verrucomicrobiota bacterium]
SSYGADISGNFHFDSRRYQWDNSGSNLVNLTRHQIPSVLDLVIVSVSEGSWGKIDSSPKGPLIKSILSTTKDTPKDASDFYKLDALTRLLDDSPVEYKVFRTSLALRSGKWITSQP